MRGFLTSVFVLLSVCVFAEDEPTKEELAWLKTGVAKASKELAATIDYKVRNGGLAQKDRVAIAAVSKELKSGKTITLPYLTLQEMKVGRIGRLAPITFDQIIDGENALVSYPDTTVTVWLKGVNTSKAADGDATFNLKQCLRVTGNKQYTTVLGATKTVLVLEPFDLKEHFPKAETVTYPAGD